MTFIDDLNAGTLLVNLWTTGSHLIGIEDSLLVCKQALSLPEPGNLLSLSASAHSFSCCSFHAKPSLIHFPDSNQTHPVPWLDWPQVDLDLIVWKDTEPVDRWPPTGNIHSLLYYSSHSYRLEFVTAAQHDKNETAKTHRLQKRKERL